MLLWDQVPPTYKGQTLFHRDSASPHSLPTFPSYCFFPISLSSLFCSLKDTLSFIPPHITKTEGKQPSHTFPERNQLGWDPGWHLTTKGSIHLDRGDEEALNCGRVPSLRSWELPPRSLVWFLKDSELFGWDGLLRCLLVTQDHRPDAFHRLMDNTEILCVHGETREDL